MIAATLSAAGLPFAGAACFVESSPDHMRLSRLHLRRYLIAGVLVITPLWVTWLVLSFIFGLLSRMGRPWIEGMKGVFQDSFLGVPAFLDYAWFESVLAAVLLGLSLLELFASDEQPRPTPLRPVCCWPTAHQNRARRRSGG